MMFGAKLATFGLWLTMQDPSGAIHGPYHLDTIPGYGACKAQTEKVEPTFEQRYPGWGFNWTCWPGQDT